MDQSADLGTQFLFRLTPIQGLYAVAVLRSDSLVGGANPFLELIFLTLEPVLDAVPPAGATNALFHTQFEQKLLRLHNREQGGR